MVDQFTVLEMQNNRRSFIRQMSILSTTLPVLPSVLGSCFDPRSSDRLNIHIFSKHLQFLDVKSAGQIAAELGFEGLDLTVRPKGHILPENVEIDLANAVKDITSSGSKVEMITTNIEQINRELDTTIIEQASKCGVKYYRSNWFKYHKELPMVESLKHYQNEIKRLSLFNKKHNIIGCYQNHAGIHIGASFWEVYQLLQSADTAYFGTQYDIRHAMVEGGYSWKNGLSLLQDLIKTIVLKDYKWAQVDGQWKAVSVPIGEGMVDFKTYFSILKSYGITPPVSLHLEYPLGGAEHGHDTISVDPKVVYDAMKKDLNTIQRLWKSA